MVNLKNVPHLYPSVCRPAMWEPRPNCKTGKLGKFYSLIYNMRMVVVIICICVMIYKVHIYHTFVKYSVSAYYVSGAAEARPIEVCKGLTRETGVKTSDHSTA